MITVLAKFEPGLAFCTKCFSESALHLMTWCLKFWEIDFSSLDIYMSWQYISLSMHNVDLWFLKVESESVYCCVTYLVDGNIKDNYTKCLILIYLSIYLTHTLFWPIRSLNPFFQWNNDVYNVSLYCWFFSLFQKIPLWHCFVLLFCSSKKGCLVQGGPGAPSLAVWETQSIYKTHRQHTHLHAH